jgi:hypothetical protein
MAYDIYGERLALGHCEVHPHVAIEYPCPQCELEIEQERRSREDAAAYDAYCEEQYRDYVEEQLAAMLANTDGDGI